LSQGDKTAISFTREEYMKLYTNVYNLSTTQDESYPAEIYKRYTESFQLYLTAHVLPRLLNLNNANLLTELQLSWQNHLVMCRWMKSFF